MNRIKKKNKSINNTPSIFIVYLLDTYSIIKLTLECVRKLSVNIDTRHPTNFNLVTVVGNCYLAGM